MQNTRDDIPLEAGNDAASIIADVAEADDLDRKATVCLCLQQLSSSFSYRAAEFALSLFFVELYTNTLLPASLYGFITTGSAILFSGSIGGLTDKFRNNRLRVVRLFIIWQKILVVSTYALFYLLFMDPRLKTGAENGGKGLDVRGPPRADVWTIFAAITFLGCFLILSNVGVSVSIERDWVTSIARGSSRRLIRLNAIMRRVDLLSKLIAPLFVSLLTSTTKYANSCVILLALSASTSVFELSFIGIVFKRFSILAEEEQSHNEAMTMQLQQEASYPISSLLQVLRQDGILKGTLLAIGQWTKLQCSDWREFARMPIFIGSISISLLYMSVLSFDPTFIAYLKSETTYSDAFIAGMRGVCVVAGLLGTIASPYFSNRIGLVRTGTWSLWAELLPLSLCIVSFYQGASSPIRPSWNTALLFTGLALSRIGLWSFDLAQLAQVQNALSLHPRRNSLMGLQFALQNFIDLGHYLMTIIFHRPSSFKIPADISYGAIGLATFIYTVFYARIERGHLLHLDRLSFRPLLRRKAR